MIIKLFTHEIVFFFFNYTKNLNNNESNTYILFSQAILTLH